MNGFVRRVKWPCGSPPTVSWPVLSALRGIDPLNAAMGGCVELAGVEMPPLSLDGMVVTG